MPKWTCVAKTASFGRGSENLNEQAVALSQQIFQLNLGVGFLVAVFYYDRGVERNPPFLARSASNGSRARDNHRMFGNDQGLVIGRAVDCVADYIVNGRRAVEDCAR